MSDIPTPRTDAIRSRFQFSDDSPLNIALLEMESIERDLTLLTAERDRLREALREAYEVYAGSDGFVPETAPEGYLQRLVRQMGEILGRALAQQDTQPPPTEKAP